MNKSIRKWLSAKLVGGWTNPSEKYARQNGNLPQIEVNTKNIWNHHLVKFSVETLMVLGLTPYKIPYWDWGISLFLARWDFQTKPLFVDKFFFVETIRDLEMSDFGCIYFVGVAQWYHNWRWYFHQGEFMFQNNILLGSETEKRPWKNQTKRNNQKSAFHHNL